MWVFADHKWPKLRKSNDVVSVSTRFSWLFTWPRNDLSENNKYRTVRWWIGTNFLLILDKFSSCSTSTDFARYTVLQNGGRHPSKHTISVHGEPTDSCGRHRPETCGSIPYSVVSRRIPLAIFICVYFHRLNPINHTGTTGARRRYVPGRKWWFIGKRSNVRAESTANLSSGLAAGRQNIERHL